MGAAPPTDAAPAIEGSGPGVVVRVPGLATDQRSAGALQLLSDYVELTKPKVQSLLLLTTIATMYVAGDPSPLLVALTCLGGYLSAGGAGAGGQGDDVTAAPVHRSATVDLEPPLAAQAVDELAGGDGVGAQGHARFDPQEGGQQRRSGGGDLEAQRA